MEHFKTENTEQGTGNTASEASAEFFPLQGKTSEASYKKERAARKRGRSVKSYHRAGGLADSEKNRGTQNAGPGWKVLSVNLALITLYLALVLFLSTSSGCSSWERCPVTIGDTVDDVLEQCGEPQDMTRSQTRHGIITTWIYHYYDLWLGYKPEFGKRYVFFRDGRVSGVHDE